ncbi:MAG TPA: hypothetical protein VEZ11_07660, partial [Thermoanaerobaculia bacterium]|nr:hypothetical protein [Thermoanaerobaculia bacterium]
SLRMRTTTKAGAALIAIAGSAAVASRTLFYFRDNFSTHYPIKTLAALYPFGVPPAQDDTNARRVGP